MKSVVTFDKEQKFLIADDEKQVNDLLIDEKFYKEGFRITGR